MIYKGYDIYYFIPELCIKEFTIYSDRDERNPKMGVVWRILSLFKHLLIELKNTRLTRKSEIPVGSTLFFGQHSNECYPYLNLFSNIQGASDKGFFIFGKRKYSNDFPYLRVYIYAFLYMPIAFRIYFLEEDDFKRKTFKYSFDQICIVLATINLLKSYLARIKPKKIIISNHNSTFHLLLLSIAHDIGIKTAYIQHALFPVGKFYFPKKIDQIFLDGKYSFQRLIEEGVVMNKVFIIGSLFQYLNDICDSTNAAGQTVGICTNQADDITDVVRLITEIREFLPEYNIIIRPHPSDKRLVFWKNLAKDFDILLSPSSVEIVRFLSSISFLFAGESNVHLVALNFGVYSYYYNFNSVQFFDWYGFLKNELIMDVSNFKNFVHNGIFKGNNVNISKIKFYNECYGQKDYSTVCNQITKLLLES